MQQSLGGGKEGVRLGCLCTEAQGITQGSQGPHPGGGKAFSGGKSPGDGQLQHQIRPTGHRCGGTGRLVDNRRAAPLDKIAAHGADNGGICPKFPANVIHLLLMAQVQGVVLTDDPDGFHGTSSFNQKFFI